MIIKKCGGVLDQKEDLQTPGTAPGTPGVPLSALLSSQALEYFSKAATENGGSSSTSVFLQSPDALNIIPGLLTG
ncbi:uncharacterized protein VP01_793g5 [Puccinia sorghi]|uniref:Uncharacterized protein n=1 Tax=Puccinia sorghi TaxID=27349 RepID=A0A0L6UAS7_9BASI|nr:uncharacterized protein VP01_793g5 [Puccinia sorghi]